MDVKNNVLDIRRGRKNNGLKKLVALGSLATLGVIGAVSCCHFNYEKKFNDSAKVYVNSEQLWEIKNQKDREGDKLISPKVSWGEFSYDVYKTNKVANARELTAIIRDNGFIEIPREDINPKYDDF